MNAPLSRHERKLENVSWGAFKAGINRRHLPKLNNDVLNIIRDNHRAKFAPSLEPHERTFKKLTNPKKNLNEGMSGVNHRLPDELLDVIAKHQGVPTNPGWGHDLVGDHYNDIRDTDQFQEDEYFKSGRFVFKVFESRGFATGSIKGRMLILEDSPEPYLRKYQLKYRTETDEKFIQSFKNMCKQVGKLIYIDGNGEWSYFNDSNDDAPGPKYWRYQFITDFLDVTDKLAKKLQNEDSRETIYELARKMASFWVFTVKEDASSKIKNKYYDDYSSGVRLDRNRHLDKDVMISQLKNMDKMFDLSEATKRIVLATMRALRNSDKPIPEEMSSDSEEDGEEVGEEDGDEDMLNDENLSEGGYSDTELPPGIIHDHGLDMQQQSSVPPPNPQPLHHVPAPVHQPPKARGIKRRRDPEDVILDLRRDPENEILDLRRDPENTILNFRRRI